MPYFIAIRGTVSKIRCDRGTNFVGAQQELAESMKDIDDEKFKMALQDQYAFQMNPPHASHMGGVWERQIRSVRNILTIIIGQPSNYNC